MSKKKSPGNASPTPTRTSSSAPPTTSRDDASTPKHTDLKPMNSKESVKKFLKAIHGGFVSKVEVVESGLLDKLIQCGVVIDTDKESLEGTHLPTRGDRARHLWQLLSKIHYEVFIRDVLPVLCNLYHHIIPEEFWVTLTPDTLPTSSEIAEEDSTVPKRLEDNEVCTRCDMVRRLRPMTMVDFLFKNGFITDDFYNKLSSNHRISPPEWPKLLAAFDATPPPTALRHLEEMATLLKRHSLNVPSDLVEQMTQGFPCRCCQRDCRKTDAVHMNTMTRKRLQMLSHLDRLKEQRSSFDSILSDTSSVYPPSETSDLDRRDSVDLLSLTSEEDVLDSAEETGSDVWTFTCYPLLCRNLSEPGMALPGNATEAALSQVLRLLPGLGVNPESPARGCVTMKAPRTSQLKCSEKKNTWPRNLNLKINDDTDCEINENLLKGRSASKDSLLSALLQELEDASRTGVESGVSTDTEDENDVLDQQSDSTAVTCPVPESSMSPSVCRTVQNPVAVEAETETGGEKVSTDTETENDIHEKDSDSSAVTCPSSECSLPPSVCQTVQNSVALEAQTETQGEKHSLPPPVCQTVQNSVALEEAQTETQGEKHSLPPPVCQTVQNSVALEAQTETQGEKQSLLRASSTEKYYTLPRRRPKKNQPGAPVVDMNNETSRNNATKRGLEELVSAVPCQETRANVSVLPNGADTARKSAHPDQVSDYGVSSLPASNCTSKTKGEVQRPTSLSLASPGTEFVPQSEPTSAERTSFSPPMAFFTEGASSDDEKFKRFSKALYKGDYERHHSVLHGPLHGETDDTNLFQDDFLRTEQDVEQHHPSDAVQVDDLSHHPLPRSAAESVQEALDIASTQPSESHHSDFLSRTFQRVEQNSDLQEFRNFASTAVTTTEQLSRLLKRAVIVDASAREEIKQLLDNYEELERCYARLSQKMEPLRQRGEEEQQQQGSATASNGTVLAEVAQLCSGIEASCQDLLVSTRTFLLCAFFLNTTHRLTKEQTRNKADAVARDVIMLMEMTSLETWGFVLRLGALKCQLPASVASHVGEIISLLRTFLESA